MSLLSRVVGRIAGLPRASTPDVLVERDLPVSMPDGITLLADRYAPRSDGDNAPTILVRCPYGRTGFFGFLFGRLIAERGYQVVIQSTRGTFGSGGVFDPYVHEHDDGLATVAWIKEQPWFHGKLATTGLSYLGYTQWAIARDAGSDVAAMAIQVSTSNFHRRTYAGGSFGLANALNFTEGIATQEQRNRFRRFDPVRRLQPVFAHLPLSDLDELAIGSHVFFFQDWLQHTDGNSDYWQARNFERTVPDITLPISMVGGWYDIFLPWQLKDYRALRDAGRKPYLLIGPWAHSSPRLMAAAIRDSLAWFDAHLREDRRRLRPSPVRIFVTGANQWRDLPDWPPPGALPQRFYLQPEGRLSTELPTASEPDRYHYDPVDPTPAVSGPMLSGNSMPTDNRALEARPDVLVYTSRALSQDFEVIGPVEVDLYVSSSLPHADFFARLCDVDRGGTSRNICDGLQRVGPGYAEPAADGTLRIRFELWPAAHRFKRGHRLRLQVSSGAHPRYARNLGSGEPLASGTSLVPADQALFHDPSHPSAIVLSS
jgi:putative CocE/NonD family hydrolase